MLLQSRGMQNGYMLRWLASSGSPGPPQVPDPTRADHTRRPLCFAARCVRRGEAVFCRGGLVTRFASRLGRLLYGRQLHSPPNVLLCLSRSALLLNKGST